jgi:hypothetical protein
MVAGISLPTTSNTPGVTVKYSEFILIFELHELNITAAIASSK